MADTFKKHTHLSRTAFGLPIFSALLLILAFPPFEQGYLAWFALMPLLWFCFRASPRQALLGGFLFGLPLHLYLNVYLTGVLFTYLPTSLAVLSTALLILLLSAFSATFTLFASYAYRQKHPLTLTLTAPSIWLIVEYARSLGFIGYNVGYLGYTQWSYPAVLNIASVYGYWGIPFIMVLFQAIAVLVFLRKLQGRSLAAAVLIVGLLAGGGTLLPNLFPTEKNETPLWTALIQGNSSPEETLSASGKEVILKRYLDLTRQAKVQEPRLELIVWPETVVDLYVREQDISHRPQMTALAKELDISILYGARVRTREDLFNAVVLLTPDGDFQSYYKHRLVPFVEYFPLKAQLNSMLNLDVTLGSYTPGSEITLFEVSGNPVAGVICFESYFGDFTRHFARLGGRHLFVLTNDAWFGETIGLEQHAQVAAIRAAELGIGVTQVANSGITISFDYQGRELLRSGKMIEDSFILPLDLASRPTIYVAAGDYFPAFWALFLIFCIVYYKLKKEPLKAKTP